MEVSDLKVLRVEMITLDRICDYFSGREFLFLQKITSNRQSEDPVPPGDSVVHCSIHSAAAAVGSRSLLVCRTALRGRIKT